MFTKEGSGLCCLFAVVLGFLNHGYMGLCHSNLTKFQRNFSEVFGDPYQTCHLHLPGQASSESAGSD